MRGGRRGPFAIALAVSAIALAETGVSAEELSLRWSTKCGDLLFVHDSPPVADGVVVLEANKGLVGVDITNGRPLWSNANVLAEPGRFGIYMAGGRVVIVTQNRVSAFEARTGAKAWDREMVCSFMDGARAAGNVLVGRCSVGTWGAPRRTSSPSLMGIDVGSGQTIWKAEPRSAFDQYETDGIFVVVSDHEVGCHDGEACKGSLAALSAVSGRELWRTNLKDALGQIVLAHKNIVFISDEITGFSKAGGKRLWRFHTKSGAETVLAPPGGLRPPVVVNDELLVFRGNGIQRLSLKDGRITGALGTSASVGIAAPHAVVAGDCQVAALVGGNELGEGGILLVAQGRALSGFSSPCNAQELDGIRGGLLFCQKDEGVVTYVLPGNGVNKCRTRDVPKPATSAEPGHEKKRNQ